MRRFKVFDSDAVTFEEFFRGNADDVWRYVRRRVLSSEDADDVTAEVFTTAWRRRDAMPSSKESRLWLFGVARKTLANHHRSARRQDRLHLRIVASTSTSATISFDESIGGNSEVSRALEALNDDDRDLLIMRAWDGLAVNEMAVVLDATPNAVSQRLPTGGPGLAAQLDEPNNTSRTIRDQHTENRYSGHVHNEPPPVGSRLGEYQCQSVKEDDNG